MLKFQTEITDMLDLPEITEVPAGCRPVRNGLLLFRRLDYIFHNGSLFVFWRILHFATLEMRCDSGATLLFLAPWPCAVFPIGGRNTTRQK